MRSSSGSFVMDSVGNSYNTSIEQVVRKFPSYTDGIVINSVSQTERRANLNADLQNRNIITAKPSVFAAMLKPPFSQGEKWKLHFVAERK